MLAIIVLCVTGYLIGSPLPSVGGEAYESYLFGWIRFTHFAAGMILGVAFLLRLYAFVVGGHHATVMPRDFLSPSIDLIVGGEEVSRSKPDPEMIRIILDRLGIPPSRAVMVGDALNDVRMGLNAGLKACIGVLTGFATRDELRSITSYVAMDVSDILLDLSIN